MSRAFEELKHPVWNYFEKLTQTPRCSGKEEKVRQWVISVAKEKGLTYREDKVGNVVIEVPATKGCENKPTIVLQGHLDIVCEKAKGSTHDFEKDPIRVERDGDWLVAPETTLGADNGIAVAAALAIIDDPPAQHGPLELLFTVDEERGLTGASGIENHMLKGRILLNLDSEEEGYVTIGCAGGGDTHVRLPLKREAIGDEYERFKLVVEGASGGHSGIDIHENRANALRLLGRALLLLKNHDDLIRICSIEGGSKRNAIPRDAMAYVALKNSKGVDLLIKKLSQDIATEFASSDPSLKLSLEKTTDRVDFYNADTSTKAITLLASTPSGVIAMNRQMHDAVETSTNLGVAQENEAKDKLEIVNCTRSSIGAALEGVRVSLQAIAIACGAEAELEDAYPGWAPDVSSKTLALFIDVHRELFGKKPEIMVIHAGLECGILGEHFAGMDMISFGPEMKGVHAPKESLCISSTERFYKLLQEMLVALSK